MTYKNIRKPLVEIARELKVDAVVEGRKHVINLLVAQRLGADHADVTNRTVQGYNVRHLVGRGPRYSAATPPD
jgi:hypothetical protein